MTDTTDEPTFRRRDLIEAERLTGTPLSKLFYEEAGEQIATALGGLAMQYVMERRSGVTDLEWDDWLEEEPEGIEVSEDDDADPS